MQITCATEEQHGRSENSAASAPWHAYPPIFALALSEARASVLPLLTLPVSFWMCFMICRRVSPVSCGAVAPRVKEEEEEAAEEEEEEEAEEVEEAEEAECTCSKVFSCSARARRISLTQAVP